MHYRRSHLAKARRHLGPTRRRRCRGVRLRRRSHLRYVERRLLLSKLLLLRCELLRSKLLGWGRRELLLLWRRKLILWH